MKYACIDKCRGRYSVQMMCRLLDVSRSGYYAGKMRPESPRSKLDRALLEKIKRVHAQRNGVFGSPRIKAELDDEGCLVGQRKIAKLMRLEHLRGVPRRQFRVPTQRDRRHHVARNLLGQDFLANKPNQKWVADMTYISTKQGWLYLAVVIDL
ncbi:MAG: IS3 family transposase [Gammaproteobacteria bacterium]